MRYPRDVSRLVTTRAEFVSVSGESKEDARRFFEDASWGDVHGSRVIKVMVWFLS